MHISTKHLVFGYFSFSIKDHPDVMLEAAQMLLYPVERYFQNKISKSDWGLMELFLPFYLSIENQV